MRQKVQSQAVCGSRSRSASLSSLVVHACACALTAAGRRSLLWALCLPSRAGAVGTPSEEVLVGLTLLSVEVKITPQEGS